MENVFESSSLDNILSNVKEYEVLIETLTSQVQFYANEQEILRKDITGLIRENKILSQTVGELMEIKISNRETEDTRIESDLVDNLKNQVNLIVKEKDTVVELWQTALKNIDRLEEHLKLFEGQTHGYFSKRDVFKMKQKYENIVNSLESSLIESQAKADKLNGMIVTKNHTLEAAVENQKQTIKQLKEMEKEVKQLQLKLNEIVKLRDELQVALDKQNFTIGKLKVKEGEAKAKVTEAIQLIEVACIEKDAAIYNETKSRDEVLKLSKTLNELLQETPEKIKVEVEYVRKASNTKVEEMQVVVEKIQLELKSKNLEIEKWIKECSSLENEIQRLQKGNLSFEDTNMNKLLILEKNLENTFQKLLVAERRNLQLEAEKENIKADLEQISDYYKRDIQTREVERTTLNHQIQTVKKQLKRSTQNLTKVSTDINKLQLEIKDKLEQESLHKQQMNECKTKFAQIQIELQNQLETHISLHKKWKRDVYLIIKKFEERLLTLKITNSSLKRELKEATTNFVIFKNKFNDIFVPSKIS